MASSASPASPTSPGSTTSVSKGRSSPIWRASGTVARPAVDGTVRVDGALYENGTTGTVLRDLALLVEGDRQTLVIRRFTATDGGAGRLNGEGTIGLDGAAGYPLDVRAGRARPAGRATTRPRR